MENFKIPIQAANKIKQSVMALQKEHFLSMIIIIKLYNENF